MPCGEPRHAPATLKGKSQVSRVALADPDQKHASPPGLRYARVVMPPHPRRSRTSQLDREIAAALAKPRAAHAKMGRHGYENGQRVIVLDYLGDEIGRGRVRSGDNYPESNEYFTWVTMTRDGETSTTEHPTRRVILGD